MPQMIFARVVLIVLAISLAIGLGMGLARAQTPGATFVFLGDVTTERQAEIRAEWADLAAWLLTEHGLQWSFDLTINVGSDHESIARLLEPGDGAPSCQWQYRGSVVFVEDCVRPNFFLELQIGWQGVGGRDYVVEAGHLSLGPWWLGHALHTYAGSRYAESRGESLELERTRRQLRAPDDWNALATLETSDAFYANFTTADELGWLAVDWLVQRAGDGSYIEYTTQRGRTPHWEDAFEEAFGLRPAAFYAEFAASRPRIERVVTGATLAQADAQDREGLWITTTLYPGLNLIGWLEALTPVGDLFDAIPRAEALFVWDAGAAVWRTASPRVGGHANELTHLRPGMGVWLRLSGTEGLRWQRRVAPRGLENTYVFGYAEIHESGDFVAWVGHQSSFDAFGDDLLFAQRWDASRQRWGPRMSPLEPEFRNGISNVPRGDALWISTSRSGLWRQVGPVRWWPDGSPGADWIDNIQFWGDVSDTDKTRLREHAADVVSFYLERFDATVFVDVHAAATDESARAMFEALHRPPGHCGQAATAEILIVLVCAGRDSITFGTFVHEYFHTLQSNEHRRRYGGDGLEPDDGPVWLIEGSAEYMSQIYRDDRGITERSGERANYVRGALRSAESLRDAVIYTASGSHYTLGVLASELLDHRFGERSLLEYFRQRALHATSAQAFEAAFGLTLDEFYDEFAAWRADGFPRDE